MLTQQYERHIVGEAELSVLGNRDLIGRLTEAILIEGGRSSTPYGDAIARDVAADLTRADLPVMVYGTRGICRAALTGVTSSGGAPIMVTGGAPAVPEALTRFVAENGGVVVTPTAPGDEVTRSRAEAAARWAATTASRVVIPEAPIRSRALRAATAAYAAGTPVAAFPGPIVSVSSEGSNGLIAAGMARALPTIGDAGMWATNT